MIYFLLSMLVCCKPAEVMLEDGTDSSSQIEPQVGEPEVPREPVGVMAAEDCQQINMGDKACDFRLRHQNGEVWSLNDYEGDIVLLDFSTVWCPPCQAAGHSTQPLQDAYGAEGVRIATILIDGAQNGVEPSEEEINTWVSDHNITTAPVLRGSRDKMMDPSGITGYPLGSWPTYLYLDRELKFYAGHSGFSEEYARQIIEEKL